MKRKIFLVLFLLIIISIYKLSEENIVIPTTSIRLRVIPNSNNPLDINIKEQVKAYLENNIYTLTKDVSNIDEARNIITTNIPNIEDNVNTIFESNNYALSYSVNYGKNYFPEKIYKGKKYQEGYYESLVIKIGEGNGDNWWCVLFPNYCMVDKTKTNKYKSYLKEKIVKHSKK